MAVKQGAVNPVFFQHEFQFLAQGFIDLPGGLGHHFFQGMV
jgi:hypothetical protein